MTVTQVSQLDAARRHVTATGGLWNAMRCELAAHGVWSQAVSEEGAGSPVVERYRQIYEDCRRVTSTWASEQTAASEALSALMLAVQQEARR